MILGREDPLEKGRLLINYSFLGIHGCKEPGGRRERKREQRGGDAGESKHLIKGWKVLAHTHTI